MAYRKSIRKGFGYDKSYKEKLKKEKRGLTAGKRYFAGN